MKELKKVKKMNENVNLIFDRSFLDPELLLKVKKIIKGKKKYSSIEYEKIIKDLYTEFYLTVKDSRKMSYYISKAQDWLIKC